MIFNCSNCKLEVNSNTKRKFCSEKCRLSKWYSDNYDRRLMANNEFRRKNPDRVKRIKLKFYYGISLEKYKEMELSQEGVCKICKRKCPSGRDLSVDHDHKTGKVRGLLCMLCNKGLGSFQDNKDNLLVAIQYLNDNK